MEHIEPGEGHCRVWEEENPHVLMSHSIIPPAYGGEAYQIMIPYDEQRIEVDPALREYLGLKPSEDDDESGEADDRGDDDASEADEIDGERETDEALRSHPNTPE